MQQTLNNSPSLAANSPFRTFAYALWMVGIKREIERIARLTASVWPRPKTMNHQPRPLDAALHSTCLSPNSLDASTLGLDSRPQLQALILHSDRESASPCHPDLSSSQPRQRVFSNSPAGVQVDGLQLQLYLHNTYLRYSGVRIRIQYFCLTWAAHASPPLLSADRPRLEGVQQQGVCVAPFLQTTDTQDRTTARQTPPSDCRP